jgi:hypothetical protein
MENNQRYTIENYLKTLPDDLLRAAATIEIVDAIVDLDAIARDIEAARPPAPPAEPDLTPNADFIERIERRYAQTDYRGAERRAAHHGREDEAIG